MTDGYVVKNHGDRKSPKDPGCSTSKWPNFMACFTGVIRSPLTSPGMILQVTKAQEFEEKVFPKWKTPGMMPQTPTPQAGVANHVARHIFVFPIRHFISEGTCHFNGHSFPVGLNPNGLISHCVDIWASIFLWPDNI